MRKPRPAQGFDGVGKTSGLGHFVFYVVFVNYDGFGAGRGLGKPRLARGFEGVGKTGGLEHLVFYEVSVKYDGRVPRGVTKS